MSGIDKAHDKDTGAMVAETGPAAIYDAEKNVPDYGSSQDDVFDPSQETLMTRLGLTFESLKRAPGSTRSVLKLFAASRNSSHEQRTRGARQYPGRVHVP